MLSSTISSSASALAKISACNATKMLPNFPTSKLSSQNICTFLDNVIYAIFKTKISGKTKSACGSHAVMKNKLR
jgi:hypothetical protein